jgi:AraC-like DNA-binding protein
MWETVLMLRLSVALLATLLACGIGMHAWRQRSFGVGCLAVWMGLLALSGWQMVVMIQPDGRLTPLARFIANGLTTLAAPLLLAYVTYAVRGVRLHWAWGLPFYAYVLAALALGIRLNGHLHTFGLIGLEYFYAGIAWVVWFRHARPLSSQRGVIAVLTGVTAAHVAQAIGILDFLGYFDYRPLRQLTLVVISAGLAIAVVMALTDSVLFRRLVPSLAPPVSDAEQALFARIERLMQDARPWRDPEFDVGAMARLLGTYPNAVSKALGRAGNTTFYDYVNEYRVREVQRLLADPTESRYKVEAIGREAGFRARSTFFKLFRQHTGLTPSEYRASLADGQHA